MHALLGETMQQLRLRLFVLLVNGAGVRRGHFPEVV